MKNNFYILLILVFASCKKEAPEPDLVKEFTIQSAWTGASYPIKVALPANYNSSQKFAAIYVLDGDEIFNVVAEHSKQISGDYGTSNALTVSIGYGNDRNLDYTPTDADEGDGGGENFMLFLRNELIPKIEQDYNADTTRLSRVILGHSFGGLLGAYAFTNHNTVFGNYILLSPSLWYDNEVILTNEVANRSANKTNHQLVFMGIGQMENSGRMRAPFEAFRIHLQNNYPDMKLKSHIVPRLGHNGSKNPNIREGLEFYFQNR